MDAYHCPRFFYTVSYRVGEFAGAAPQTAPQMHRAVFEVDGEVPLPERRATNKAKKSLAKLAPLAQPRHQRPISGSRNAFPCMS
jgi:hypothetical protein